MIAVLDKLRQRHAEMEKARLALSEAMSVRSALRAEHAANEHEAAAVHDDVLNDHIRARTEGIKPERSPDEIARTKLAAEVSRDLLRQAEAGVSTAQEAFDRARRHYNTAVCEFCYGEERGWLVQLQKAIDAIAPVAAKAVAAADLARMHGSTRGEHVDCWFGAGGTIVSLLVSNTGWPNYPHKVGPKNSWGLGPYDAPNLLTGVKEHTAKLQAFIADTCSGTAAGES